MDPLVTLRPCFRESTFLLVHPLVLELAVHGELIVGELALHPFEPGEPRAVDVLVQHSGRDEREPCPTTDDLSGGIRHCVISRVVGSGIRVLLVCFTERM